MTFRRGCFFGCAFVLVAAACGSGSDGNDQGTQAVPGAGGGAVSGGSGGASGSAGKAGSGGHSGAAAASGSSGHGGAATGGASGGGGAQPGGAGTGAIGGSGTAGASGMGTAGASGTGGAGAGGASGQGGAAATLGPESVLQHHKRATRDGLYEEPALTKSAAAGLHADPSFSAMVDGAVYAQLLYVDDPGGKDLVIAVTENDSVLALDASTGNVAWKASLGIPGNPNTFSNCPGNIAPLGVTGTPVIDEAARTLYVDGMVTPDGDQTHHHEVFALSIDDGSVRAGFPIDLEGRAFSQGTFQSDIQNQRGALLLWNGRLYVPFGGLYGDCGPYRGWVIGISTSDPTDVKAWAPEVQGAGIWAPGGLSSDGSGVFAVTGNGFGSTWGVSEAVVRLSEGPTFSMQTADYFVPSDWQQLDQADIDLSGSGVVFADLPGATPSALAVALGKDGKAYLLDRTNLGGIGGALDVKTVSSEEIIQAAAVYTTSMGTYVAFRGAGTTCPNGGSGELTAIRIVPGSPPTIEPAWCADSGGLGSPMVTVAGGDSIVWTIGAEGSNTLRGFDGDTGAMIVEATPAIGNARRYSTPIAAKGRIFAASDQRVVAFTPLCPVPASPAGDRRRGKGARVDVT